MVVSIALLLDWFLAEPGRWHPLSAFGYFVERIEQLFYRKDSIFRGILLWLLAVLPLFLIACYFSGSWPLDSLVLYLAIGHRSMHQHADNVKKALEQGDLILAREKLALIVSRDVSQLNEDEVAKACIESVLENGCDSTISPLCWYLLAGMPGVVLCRLANTLDAIWGYKNERYGCFGFFSAKVDDAINWLPARVTALLYASVGQWRSAVTCWRQQADCFDSPNAGVTMAAGAGALNIRLGGHYRHSGTNSDVNYSHKNTVRHLGVGRDAEGRDISLSLVLLRHSVLVFAIASLSVEIGVYLV